MYDREKVIKLITDEFPFIKFQECIDGNHIYMSYEAMNTTISYHEAFNYQHFMVAAVEYFILIGTPFESNPLEKNIVVFDIDENLILNIYKNIPKSFYQGYNRATIIKEILK